MNIQMKIEAKQVAYLSLMQLAKMNNATLSVTLKNLYDTFSKDTFQLPYKVQRLSKRARRSLI